MSYEHQQVVEAEHRAAYFLALRAQEAEHEDEDRQRRTPKRTTMQHDGLYRHIGNQHSAQVDREVRDDQRNPNWGLAILVTVMFLAVALFGGCASLDKHELTAPCACGPTHPINGHANG